MHPENFFSWCTHGCLYMMVAHFIMCTYGVNQASRFSEGIQLHRVPETLRMCMIYLVYFVEVVTGGEEQGHRVRRHPVVAHNRALPIDVVNQWPYQSKLLILDGNLEIGAHVRSNLRYSICLRHLNESSHKSEFFLSEKTYYMSKKQ